MPTKKQIWNEPIKEHLFEERWRERALEEGANFNEITADEEDNDITYSEVEKNKQINVYLEMVEAIDDDEELKPYLSDLDAAILRYFEAMKNLSQKRSALEREEMEAADWARRTAHNAVVARLTALSRAYVQKTKKPNAWRLKIDEGQGDRERISNWVKAIAPFVDNKYNNQ
jgi:ribosomal protein L11 methylase PrmA